MKGGFSLGQKILCVVLLCFAIPLVTLFLFSYFRMESILRDNTTTLTNRDLDILSSDLQLQFSRMNEAGLLLAADQKTNRLLSEYHNASDTAFELRGAGGRSSMDPYAFLMLYEEIDGTLTNLISYQFPSSTQACLITADGSLFSTWPSINTDLSFFETADWLVPMLTYSDQPDALFIHDSYLVRDSHQRYISYVRKIPNLQAPSQTMGLLLISIPEQVLTKFLRQSAVARMASFCLSSDGGEVLLAYHGSGTPLSEDFSPSKLDFSIRQQRLDGRDYFVNGRNIDVLGGTLVCLIPNDVLYRSIRSLRYTVLFLSIGFILGFSFLTLFRIRHLLTPLKTLHESILKVEQGDVSADVPIVSSRDELAKLAGAYNDMLVRLRRLLKETAENERRENELKFEMRMAQINPHFLFNTLNSIKWMALMVHADNISDTIVSLGRLLEISMNRQGDTIALREEIENLKSYLEIQKLRYRDLFTVHFDLAPGTETIDVPILILQPIVENSILHNIGECERLEIRITSAVCEGALLLSVADNGCGMSAEQVDFLLSPTARANRKSVFHGIGINNVHERIQLKFGADYGLSIHSVLGEGTTVVIRLPQSVDDTNSQ